MREDAEDDRIHRLERYIEALPDAIYQAFLKPERLVRWMPPDDTMGDVEVLEPWAGGQLRMTLIFANALGKTSSNTDVVDARFFSLRPNEQIVLGVTFASDRAEFQGMMTMTWSLVPAGTGTQVSIVAETVPISIGRADYELDMPAPFSARANPSRRPCATPITSARG
jgi:uncharacterized protein YndB with AHSA1/START domain